MSNELKPCPCCGSKSTQLPTTVTPRRTGITPKAQFVQICRECGMGVHTNFPEKALDRWNRRVVELSPEQQKWLELAPVFDTEKYEYLWQENTVNWVDETGIPDEYELYQKGLLRKSKQPEWDIVLSDACAHIRKNGKLHESISIEAYKALFLTKEAPNATD